MVNQEILDYVKKELAKGIHRDKLRQVLLEYGWPEFEINEAFEQAKEVKPEKPPEKISKEVEEKLGEVKPEEKLKKFPVEEVKKLITNKIFIIAVAVIILGAVAFFILPSFFEAEEVSGGAMDYAEKMCRQYCNSNLCGLVNDPGFSHPELVGKNCDDLGFSCLNPSGEPKCETEY